jgi:hypothetical protein
MDIKQILDMPIGQKLGGCVLTTKTAGKKWSVGDDWFQKVVFMDKTGEIPADVIIGTNGYVPLQRGAEYRIIVAEIHAAEKGTKLFVHEHAPKDYIGEPPQAPDMNEADRIVRSKIKCWLVAACLQGNQPIETKMIDDLVDYIIK